MPDTVVGVLVAVAVVLPGFVIAELSVVGRARAARSDLELVLRALFYALLLHLVASPFTKMLVDEIGSLSNWQWHLVPLIAYTGVVLVAAPVAIGLALGAYLRKAERRATRPGTLYEVLGARDAGDAWDVLFQQLFHGAWVIVQLQDGQYLGGEYGEGSAVGQTPSPHDLFLRELWHVEAGEPDPRLVGPYEPRRGIYIAADEVRSVRVFPSPEDALQSEAR